VTKPNNSQNPWVQLYEARRNFSEPQSRPPGRPPSLVPRHKVGMTLSQGEINELEVWQNRFSELLGRKVSAGEAVGILTRIVSARLTRVESDGPFETLAELVERLVGETGNVSSEK
jgi:hypothetical protein